MDMEANKETAALERSLSTVTYWYFVVPACHAPYQSRPTINVRPRVAAAARAGTTCACARRTATRRRASFDAIDDARFGHAEEFRCLDVRARRLFVRRTRLLCRKCGASLPALRHQDLPAPAARRCPRRARQCRGVTARVLPCFYS
jgi:hypothetical protein